MKKNFRSIFAFSLVEVTIALGIASFCLIAIMGLIPVGLNSTQSASEQFHAMNIIGNIAADLKSSAKSDRYNGTAANAVSARYSIPMMGGTTNAANQTLFFENSSKGTLTTTAPTDARYQVRITYTNLQNVGTTTGLGNIRYQPYVAKIVVAWPAQAAWPTADALPPNAQGSVTSFVSYSRFSRN